VKPRSLKEIEQDLVVKDVDIGWRSYELYGETILSLSIPATKRHVWMYNHITDVITNFIKERVGYYFTYTPHQTKIDLIRVLHKDLKKLLRKMYKHYPVEFGYALKAPCDMHDDEMAERVALERLINKIKGAV